MAEINTWNPQKIRGIVAEQGGFATTEKFMIIFSGNGVANLDQGTLQNLSFLCENCTLPTKSISGNDKFIYGTNYQLPYRQAFAEVSMNFYMTEGMMEKRLFDDWQNKIVDPVTGDLKFHKNYVAQINIYKFPRNAKDFILSEATYVLTLLDAWPSIVAETQLQHSGGNEIARLPVTFQYRKWLQGTGTGLAPQHQGGDRSGGSGTIS